MLNTVEFICYAAAAGVNALKSAPYPDVRRYHRNMADDQHASLLDQALAMLDAQIAAIYAQMGQYVPQKPERP